MRVVLSTNSALKTTDDLMDILTAVNLAYLPEREGGWTTRKEWRDVLSGGEKQRVCHNVFIKLRNNVYLILSDVYIRWEWLGFSITNPSLPSSMVCILFSFFFLSWRRIYPCLECTSAVSSDVEGRMYEHAKSLGITLITISLRFVLPNNILRVRPRSFS